MKHNFFKSLAVSAAVIATSAAALSAYAVNTETSVNNLTETSISQTAEKANEKNPVKASNKSIITKFKNTETGTKITWAKNKKASKYAVYCLVKNEWKKLAVVSGESYTHKNLKTGKTYTYSVRCLDGKGKVIGDYDKKGASNTFYANPEVISIINVNGGVQINWKKVDGIKTYRIYRKTKSSKWRRAGITGKTTFIDKKAVSGTEYTYAVVCLGEDKKLASCFSELQTISYVKSPVITKFENRVSGTKIKWSKVSGAVKYAVYCLDSNGKWKKSAVVSSTEYTHSKLKNGTEYKYRIRCVGKNGKFISGASKVKSNVFVSPVKISVAASEYNTVISWSSVSLASSYSVYRKTLGEDSWKKLADVSSGNSYTDTTAEKDKIYSYAVRCVDGKGRLISYYPKNVKFYLNGKVADGKIKLAGKTYNFADGVLRSGLQVINGKNYYYDSNGNLQKNGIVGSAEDGWYYADKNGVIDMNYVTGVEENGVKWIIINGVARKAVTKSDKVLYRAAIEAEKATDTTMTKEEKLKACFEYSQDAYTEKSPRIPHYTAEDWPMLYADDMFVRDGGNCCSYAAAFAYMARAIGYEEVYCCNSGGHGWAEIDGKIYDPEWGRHYKNYTYFGLDYDEIRNPNYKGAIAAMEPWMHIKIK